MKSRLYNKLYFIPLLALMAFTGVACSDNDDVQEEANLTIDTQDVKMNRLGLTIDGDSATVFISSNVYWQGSMDDDAKAWLEMSYIGGSGDTEVTLRAKHNNTNTTRDAKITLHTLEGKQYTFNVSQTGNNEVVYFVNENFDKSPSEMLPVSIYDGWNNQGISGLVFKGKGEGVVVDSSNPSSGYPDASGGNNLYFQDANSNVLFGPFNTKKQTTFKLSFASMSTSVAFNANDLVLQVSKDNKFWTDLDYTRTTTSAWAKAEKLFYYDDTFGTLYFRLVAKTATTFRVDDLIIEENGPTTGEKVDLYGYIDDGRPDGFVYFEDDFSWITVGPDFINNTQDSKTEVRFDNIDEQAKQDSTQNARLVASGWTWGTDALIVYMHKGYVKLAKAAAKGTLVAPALKEIGTGTDRNATLNLKVSFDASMYQAKDGSKDPLKPIIVTIDEGTSGAINNGTDKKASFQIVSYNNDMKTFSFKIYEATSNTRIRFTNSEDNKCRIFLDNVKIEKIPRGS